MPTLDRRITVVFTNFSRDRKGQSVEEKTLYPVWATRRDASATDTPLADGQLSTATREYVVRWRKEFIEYLDDDDEPPVVRAVLPSQLSIRDPDLDPEMQGENELSVDDVITVSDRGPIRERRRFIKLLVLGETV